MSEETYWKDKKIEVKWRKKLFTVTFSITVIYFIIPSSKWASPSM